MPTNEPIREQTYTRIAYLDGWRGLAIAFVLVFHFLPSTGADLGRLGVDIFFVLSGMLMSNILFVKRTPLPIFYKRRISRIFPVFVLYIIFIYSSAYLLALSDEYRNAIYTLLFLRTYLPVFPDIWHAELAIGHLWSLHVEEHCYLFLSFITLIGILRNRESVFLVLVGCATIALHAFYIFEPQHAPNYYFLRTEIAASHLLLSAGYFLVKRKWGLTVKTWIPLVTFVGAVCCYIPALPLHDYGSWLLSPFLLAFTVNHLDDLSEYIKNLLSCKALTLLGLWSYSIYIWQQPFFYYGIDHGMIFNLLSGHPLGILLGRLFLLGLAIVTGTISFYWFEHPLRQWHNKNW
jgi:peptidoglycan/LPS O-acetylase OafA/YrhL